MDHLTVPAFIWVQLVLILVLLPLHPNQAALRCPPCLVCDSDLVHTTSHLMASINIQGTEGSNMESMAVIPRSEYGNNNSSSDLILLITRL